MESKCSISWGGTLEESSAVMGEETLLCPPFLGIEDGSEPGAGHKVEHEVKRRAERGVEREAVSQAAAAE